jgi:hypothetical protein
LVKWRDQNHHKNDKDYEKACLDEWALALLPREQRRNAPSYRFIRGIWSTLRTANF